MTAEAIVAPTDARRVAVFVETGEERVIVRRCRRCARYLRWAPDYGVVSPQGVEHIGADFGRTACGRDATGEGWWWAVLDTLDDDRAEQEADELEAVRYGARTDAD